MAEKYSSLSKIFDTTQVVILLHCFGDAQKYLYEYFDDLSKANVGVCFHISAAWDLTTVVNRVDALC